MLLMQLCKCLNHVASVDSPELKACPKRAEDWLWDVTDREKVALANQYARQG